MVKQEELPVSFAMELAKHPQVLKNLARLPREEQDRVIDRSRSFPSRDELKNYVESLTFQ